MYILIRSALERHIYTLGFAKLRGPSLGGPHNEEDHILKYILKPQFIHTPTSMPAKESIMASYLLQQTCARMLAHQLRNKKSLIPQSYSYARKHPQADETSASSLRMPGICVKLREGPTDIPGCRKTVTGCFSTCRPPDQVRPVITCSVLKLRSLLLTSILILPQSSECPTKF